MDHGKIIAQGNPKALLADHFDNSVITLPRDALPEKFDLHEGASIHPQGDSVEIMSQDVESTIHLLTANQIPLRHLQVRTPTLEDLFLELTGHNLRN
jgi:ABC-2 type transport system ATP-binding protein